MNYGLWLEYSDDELRRMGLAAINLAAAAGLPGTVALGMDECQARLDEWATIIDRETKMMLGRRAQCGIADFTENRFLVLVMTTILQRDLGAIYNTSYRFAEYDVRDSNSSFLHGILSGQGGTCASLPFLFTAIGRKLNYPLFVVQGKEHLFVRWDGRGECFNIESTARGFLSHDDDHYREWPMPITNDDLRLFPQFLRNMSPREELACCIMERSRVLFDNHRFLEALEAANAAARISSYYAGARLVAMMACQIMLRLQKLPVAHRYKSLKDGLLVVARNPVEAWAIENATAHLMRQFTIRGSQLSPPVVS